MFSSGHPAKFVLKILSPTVTPSGKLAAALASVGGGGGTAEDSRIAIQSALDTALVAAGLAAGSVIASIDENDGGLVLTTLATGASETLEISADDGVLGLNPYLGVRTGTDGSLEQTQAAQSAEILVNGLTITRETNLVAEVIKGVTLNLQTADVNKTIKLNLSSNPDAIVDKVQSLQLDSLAGTLNKVEK